MPELLSKIPYGMRYHSGAEARLRRQIEDTAMRVFDGWSYSEIVTPALDYYALFESGMGADEAQRAFRFTDTDGRLVALRPDTTSGIARAAATLFSTAARPLRFAYAAPVWRQQPRSHAEWRRETKQLGCELIGIGGAAGEVEMLLIISEVFRKLNLQDSFRVTLNHVGVFNGITERLKLEHEAREHLRRLVDARNYSALQDFLRPLTGSHADTINFAHLMRLSGKAEMFTRARDVISNKRSRQSLDELESVWRALESLKLTSSFEIDLGDTANLDYYTGAVFRIYLRGVGAQVGSGGRYDELLACFGAAESAVGFVLDLELLTEAIRAKSQRSSSDSTRPATHEPESVRHESVGDEDVDQLAGAVQLKGEEIEMLFTEAVKRRERGERVRVGGNAEWAI